MNKKILNLVKQMSHSEKQTLFDHIKRQYTLEEKKGMLRDDIKDKIIAVMLTEFNWIDIELKEDTSLQAIGLDPVDATALSTFLLEEFELDNIEFSDIMEWQTLKDVITYIEEALECALHDREDN